MAPRPELIYCGGGSKRFAAIAQEIGFRYGARLPSTLHGPLYFADQDWRAPHRRRYMAALATHRPHVATVLDWEAEAQLAEVLDWAEEAAQHVSAVIIIPKVMGGIPRIPHRIGGAEVVLGYSVPTRFGGTSLPVWEWMGRQIHLLGGPPHRQLELWRYLSAGAEVVSVDGNFAQKMAVRWCEYWVPGNVAQARSRWWTTIRHIDGERWGDDAPYEAFRRSCINIQAAWNREEGAGDAAV